MNDIINKYNLKTFVETGTGEGDSLFYAAKHSFEHCYSIETKDQLFEKTSKIFNSDYISVLNGPYSQELKKLFPKISSDPILFFLDDPQLFSSQKLQFSGNTLHLLNIYY